MINNATDRSIIQDHITNSNITSLTINNKNILNNITQVQNQCVGLMNLSAELKQKIAFYLDGISYFNLRLTAKEIHDSLPSFKEILSQLKNEISGEIQERYISMYERSIKQLIENEKKNDVIQGLKRIFVGSYYAGADITTIHTTCRLDYTLPNDNWSGCIFVRCRDEVIQLSNNQF